MSFLREKALSKSRLFRSHHWQSVMLDWPYPVYQKKMSKGIGVLQKTKRVLGKDASLTLYNCLIYRRAVRLITPSPFRAHSERLFVPLKILSVFDVYFFRLSIILFRYEDSLLVDCANSILIRNCDIYEYCTHQAGWLHVLISTKWAIQRTERLRCVKILNHICSIDNLNCSIACFQYNLMSLFMS